MNYIKVHWAHQNQSDPIWLFIEIDGKRWETRKIEIFPDGSKGYASKMEEVGGAALGKVPVPPLAEIIADPQFSAQEITKAEFEAEWNGRGNAAS